MLIQNIIHCGNAFDLLKEVEDETVDLIVCDGFYGVTKNDWDRIIAIQDFNLDLIRYFVPKLKDGGALYLFDKPDCLERTSIDLNQKKIPSLKGRNHGEPRAGGAPLQPLIFNL